MIKHLLIVATLAASCVSPAAGFAQTRTDTPRATGVTTRQLDPAKRAWLGQAMSHILGDDDAGRSGAR